MPSAPVPANEAERLAALRSLRVLDTPPDQGFDDLTSLARDALGLPTASISLVDEHRQWLKSSAGIDPAEAACDVPRSQSICAYVVHSAEPLVIDDLAADERTRDNPLVTGATGLRFYAGAPIVLSTGEAVGSFCVEDRRPNSLTEHQTAMLERFASAAASMLESRRAERALLEADHRLKSIQDATPVGLLHLEAVRDHRTRVVDFRIADANSTARGLLSLPEPCVGSALAERVPAVREADDGAVWHAMLHTSASGDPTTVEAECGDRGRTLTLRWKFARLDCCVVASVEDVTAIRKAERVKSEREQLMRQFVQHTPVAVAMFDTTMRYLVASDKWYTDNGLPHQDLEGLHHYDVFPHLGEDWRSFHRRALNGESLSRERYCYERPDGRTQWLRWQMYPWQHDDGTVGGIIVFTEDITARAEQDLIIERSRDLLEQTQAMSGVGGWSLDLTTGELHWTEQTFAIHGMSAAEGEPDVSRAIDKYAPEHRAMVREVVDRAANGTEPFDFEAEIIRTDGVHVPVRAIGCPVVQHGRVVRLVGAFQDLTRIRAEQEQRDRSLAMLRVMSEGTDDLIFVKDIKGRFLFANPAMAEFCGVAPGDMLGKTDDEVMPAHIAELCRSGDLKVLATGASTTFGEELPTPSGLRHYNTLKQPYRLSDGTVAGVITLCHDITEVREQEAESRRLREIIEAITDASSDVIFVKDREGKLIFCNPAFIDGPADGLGERR
ncbi:MAG: PAS domain-containing protein, partial [Planctomycetota bacterium]